MFLPRLKKEKALKFSEALFPFFGLVGLEREEGEIDVFSVTNYNYFYKEAVIVEG